MIDRSSLDLGKPESTTFSKEQYQISRMERKTPGKSA
jgi:hypothetical protein